MCRLVGRNAMILSEKALLACFSSRVVAGPVSYDSLNCPWAFGLAKCEGSVMRYATFAVMVAMVAGSAHASDTIMMRPMMDQHFKVSYPAAAVTTYAPVATAQPALPAAPACATCNQGANAGVELAQYVTPQPSLVQQPMYSAPQTIVTPQPTLQPQTTYYAPQPAYAPTTAYSPTTVVIPQPTYVPQTTYYAPQTAIVPIVQPIQQRRGLFGRTTTYYMPTPPPPYVGSPAYNEYIGVVPPTTALYGNMYYGNSMPSYAPVYVAP